jgi:hypothetical protein
MKIDKTYRIAAMFNVPEPIEVSDFPDRGNINSQTYLITAGFASNKAEYILQQLNPDVFKQPATVMEAMILCIDAQRKALSEGALQSNEEWETIRLVPTRERKAYIEMQDENKPVCWRLMDRIMNSRSYKNLGEVDNEGDRLRLAEEVGRGLALFGVLTSAMNPSEIRCPLPGYRDTKLYYNQLFSVLEGHRDPHDASSYLPADPTIRQSTEQHFLVHIPRAECQRRRADPQISKCIDIALNQKSFALKISRELSAGILKTVVIHGDTKLENFLFSTSTGKAKALVDLDTVMPHTWLSDWGDMVRSLINLAGEQESNLIKVKVDLRVFESVARGFLNSARCLNTHEMSLMVDAMRTMSLELGVRFLADYLRGDNYFTLGARDPNDLNKIRALVQFRLFEEMSEYKTVLENILSSVLGKDRAMRCRRQEQFLP